VARALMFTGTYDRQLDDKGRLALPAQYKQHFGESCYVVKGGSGCLQVFLTEDFEAEADWMHDRVQRGEMSADEMRSRMASADHCKVDRQGRISIVEHLRTFARLDAPMAVVLAGAYNRLEIWEPERFRQLSAAQDERMSGVAS
jgi:MraZ protein